MASVKDNANNYAIEFRDYSFAYPNCAPCVRNATTTVAKGEFCLVVGKTGSGKTTLLRSLVPALVPAGTQQGEVAVFSRLIAEYDAAQAACTIGFVSQDPETQVVCDTVWHEMAFGLENRGMPQDQMRQRIAEVAHFFGIAPWFHLSVNELSGGQLQLLTLASVLALQPSLIVLDEPTAQLDPLAEKTFLHALFRINRELGITVLLATHNPQTVAPYATCALRVCADGIRDVSLKDFAGHPLFDSSIQQNNNENNLLDEVTVALSAASVFFRYKKSGEWVLKSCSCRFSTGQIHALVGGNGSGKTTLLHLLAGILKPDRGRVQNKLAASQGLVPQSPASLFVCDTVEEELREWQVSAGFTDDERLMMMARLGLATCSHQHPLDLSGGQQQLLAIAKVLLTKPQLLLLDEPTKGLDAAMKKVLASVLRDLSQEGVTIVIATHDITFAAINAQITSLLFDGQIACSKPSIQFFSESFFYQPLFDEYAGLEFSRNDKELKGDGNE